MNANSRIYECLLYFKAYIRPRFVWEDQSVSYKHCIDSTKKSLKQQYTASVLSMRKQCQCYLMPR